jgi:hypothetical protein
MLDYIIQIIHFGLHNLSLYVGQHTHSIFKLLTFLLRFTIYLI